MTTLPTRMLIRPRRRKQIEKETVSLRRAVSDLTLNKLIRQGRCRGRSSDIAPTLGGAQKFGSARLPRREGLSPPILLPGPCCLSPALREERSGSRPQS